MIGALIGALVAKVNADFAVWPWKSVNVFNSALTVMEAGRLYLGLKGDGTAAGIVPFDSYNDFASLIFRPNYIKKISELSRASSFSANRVCINYPMQTYSKRKSLFVSWMEVTWSEVPSLWPQFSHHKPETIFICRGWLYVVVDKQVAYWRWWCIFGRSPPRSRCYA